MEVYARGDWYMSDGCDDYIFEIAPMGDGQSVAEFLGNPAPQFPYVYTTDTDDEEKMSHAEFIAKYGDWCYIDICWSGAT